MEKLDLQNLSAEEARSKGLCEKCKVEELATMHYCSNCMKLIRERKKANQDKRMRKL